MKLSSPQGANKDCFLLFYLFNLSFSRKYLHELKRYKSKGMGNEYYFIRKKNIICLRYKVIKPNSGKVYSTLTTAKSSVDEGIWRIRIIFTDIQAN